MAKLLKYNDFCVRVDAIVYMTKIYDKQPGIMYYLKGITSQFQYNLATREERDRVYDEWLKAIEEV